VTRLSERTARRPDMPRYLNDEVGTHVSHDALLSHHHAVIYAVGAAHDRSLGIPGEDLPGSHSATEFVAWYNGHPGLAGRTFDLSADRAVIVGNGNVALDVARILVSDIDDLSKTDIADHALETLATRNISEVVILGRRGPAQAAYTVSEMLSLTQIPATEVVAFPG
jgi:ferredoxin--NADP+ reductase